VWWVVVYARYYKGCTPRFARVVADVAIVMTLYEQIGAVLDRLF
jgi:hypothetical protein